MHLSIGNILNFDSDSYEICSTKITNSIKRLYKLHPTNYAAAIIQGKENTNIKCEVDDIENGMNYLEKRMSLIQEEIHPYLLKQYSNPVLVK